MTSEAHTIVLATDLGYTEGPAQLNDGRLLFTSLDGCLFVARAERVTKTIDTGNGPTGIAIAADDSAYVACCSGTFGSPSNAPGGIYRYSNDVFEAVIVEGLSAPNDICFGPDGRLYFTDPTGDESALVEPIDGAVYRYDLESGRLETLDPAARYPNGLAFGPTGEHLYVAHTQTQQIVRYAVGPGGVSERTVLCHIDDGAPDGMAIDADGNIWQCVNETDSIFVFDPTGRELDRIHCGEGAYPSNCCFGGPDRRSLYITTAGTGGLIRIDAGVTGLALYPFR